MGRADASVSARARRPTSMWKLALAALVALAEACAQPPAPAPLTVVATAPPPRVALPTSPPVPPQPALSLLLRPLRDPARVHVELELDTRASDLGTWRLAEGTPAQLSEVLARDASGTLLVDVREDGAGVALVLGRPPSGHLHLAYDVRVAGSRLVEIRGDRFRAQGEPLVALPDAILDDVLPVSVDLDLAPFEAEKGASSFGVGAHRTARLRPRALRLAEYLIGAHDEVVFDTIDGHDEAAWLGAPAFDLRELVVQLAEERTAMAELLGGRSLLPDVPWTYLFEITGGRSFAVTPRVESMFVELESSDRLEVGLRLTLAELLARRWIGDAIRLAPSGHAAELAWFDEGFSRYFATRVLARLGLVTPREWAGIVGDELASLATSRYARDDNASLSARAHDDLEAQALLVARGALFAARESAVIAGRTGGVRNLEAVLATLLERARSRHDVAFQPLSPAALLEELTKDDPDALRTFNALVLRGQPIALPAGALGPCFRRGEGEYVAFDPGFDVPGTRSSANHRLVGLREGGVAAKAGLVAGEEVLALDARDGDASVPVRVTVLRDGEKRVVSYSAAGRRGRGQTWTRVAGTADDRCGLPP